ncbi:MAG: right-handed parallel beta-helix repeat-containing protein, partial [Planctomycetota bacterium]
SGRTTDKQHTCNLFRGEGGTAMFRYDHLLIVAVVGLFSAAAAADTIYVDDDNCPGPGEGSELNPYCSIQTAIDNAVDTDEIVVAPGTYFETINFLGKAVWLHSSGGAEVTIIDGDCSGRVVACNGGEGPDSVLEGFTITDGAGYCGGGMYNYGSSPTVANCIFDNNFKGFGGGMYNTYSNPTVTDCTFSGNRANYGGGMYNRYSNPTVSNCTFSGNLSGWDGGGGIYNWGSSPTVTDCTFRANRASAENGGGGMFNFAGSNPTVSNCTFEGNGAWINGGGMYNSSSSSPTVTDCTFTDNWAAYGGGMYNTGGPTVTDCRFTDNWAAYAGGGMFNGGGSPTVTDCTFIGNIAQGAGDQEGAGGGMCNWDSSPTVTDCRFERNTANGYGGGMSNWWGTNNPTITDSFFCENTPDAISGPWDGDDNTFNEFCRVFGFDTIDVGGDDLLNLLDH